MISSHTTEIDSRLDDFWQKLAASQKARLLLDYDGTLAPFQVERSAAFPYPGVRELLTQIRRDTQTQLVIISGRAIDDLLPLLGLDPAPEIWGCHGWERLDSSGCRSAVDLPARAIVALESADICMKDQGFDSFCEKKPASLAIHWRGLLDDQIKTMRESVSTCWEPIAANGGLELHPFNGGLELRCPGRDKGTAINAILAESEPEEPIAFLGDDLTDEDGFVMLKGRGLGVLVSNESRETTADLQIRPPESLLDFLSTWHDKAPARSAQISGERA